MDKKEEVKSFEYLFLKDDGFHHKKDTRKRNDIVVVKLMDNSETARIYLNNTDDYVDVPVNRVMLNELAHITWTKDSSSEKGVFIKSDADDISLNSLLQRYSKDYKYKLYKVKDEGIDPQKKKFKRKRFIEDNTNANTEKAFN